MAPLIENPELLNGKIIRPEDVGTKVFNALARAGIGLPEDQQSYLDAKAVANSADSAQELKEKTSTRPGGGSFYGMGVDTAEEVIKFLQDLASR